MDNWFHLAPGTPRRVPLVERDAGKPPSGWVTAINATERVPFMEGALEL